MKSHKKAKWYEFSQIAKKTSDMVGNFWTFLTAFFLCVVWLISGPFFNYSDTWQLVINTSTTIITFLMVFIIQNTQNRETTVMNLKLDELIKSTKGADNSKFELEDLSEEELKKILKEFKEHLTQNDKK